MKGTSLEMWGGLEGTVNRVEDRYFDQCTRNGHDRRLDDLDRFASLGIRAIRYPVLWEKVAPSGLASANWSLPDAQLGRLRALGVRPIVGLVHHGSGPRDTSLVDPAFPRRLAEYARAVAERFPWVEEWTPVNEPLTTARFSCLYGHWYPHHRDPRSFVRALLVQCRAVVEAMRAVRTVNPAARLVQTDDMGQTTSTPRLEAEARAMDERRWVTWDLLCGRVDAQHPLWPVLRDGGASEEDLAYFLENPTPPDVVGLNYYLTSDRHLDERVERYPQWARENHGPGDYADIEAVRVWGPGISGHATLLRRAWERYRLPVAFTEVHLGCTREEQLRWLQEAWDAAKEVRAEGADVRAITVWSLLGAFDWNSLVTREANFYEPGVFDVRDAHPRQTAIGTMTRALAVNGHFEHPVLAGPGWWRRPDRLFYPVVGGEAAPAPAARGREAPVVILGGTSVLGRAIVRSCQVRGLAYIALSRNDLDITDEAAVTRALEQHAPWAVINTVAFGRVDEGEREPQRCHLINAQGPVVVAAACAKRGIQFVSFSSDLVFDGTKQAPYTEVDGVRPLNVFGRSKVAGENGVLVLHPDSLVIRSGPFFGPGVRRSFLLHALHALEEGRPVRAAEDMVVSPTYVPDLVEAALDLLVDGARGIWHLNNAGAASWASVTRMAAELRGLEPNAVEPCTASDLGLAARRPLYRALSSRHGTLLPPLEDALARFLSEPAPAEASGKSATGAGRNVCGVCGSASRATAQAQCEVHF